MMDDNEHFPSSSSSKIADDMGQNSGDNDHENSEIAGEIEHHKSNVKQRPIDDSNEIPASVNGDGGDEEKVAFLDAEIYYDEAKNTAYLIDENDADSLRHFDGILPLDSRLVDARHSSLSTDSESPSRRYVIYAYRDSSGEFSKITPEKFVNGKEQDVESTSFFACFVCRNAFSDSNAFAEHVRLRHDFSILENDEEDLEFTSAILVKKIVDDDALFRVYFLRADKEISGVKINAEQSEKEEVVEDEEKTGKEKPENPCEKMDMSPAEIARTVMLASELSASRLLQQVSQNVLYTAQTWPMTSGNADAAEQQMQNGGSKSTNNACTLHPETMKSAGVECPKCDLILGSSRSLGGHMTMTHSRNSCKTLKCPKCNWHYKYPETLEIHMKEKHPDNEVNCVYCITNQTHPRLSRGETYTCGYKPFRCDICKYSTTTKGNLSIHMQSDKHLNNVQELQQGKLMAQAQQTPAPMSVLNFGAGLPSMHVHGATPTAMAAAELEAAGKAAEAALALAQACGTSTAAVKMAPIKNRPSWRCDVCNYETSVARNLRIHMTSEKHAHNMNVLQQSMKQLHDTIQGFTGVSAGSTVQGASSLVPLSLSSIGKDTDLLQQASLASGLQQAVSSGASMQQPSNASILMSTGGGHNDLDASSAFQLQAQFLRRAVENGAIFQCCVCMTFCSEDTEELLNHVQRDRGHPNDGDVTTVAGLYYCNLCRYKTHLKANFQLHTKTDKHLQRLQLVNHVREGGGENEWRLKYLNPANPVQLRCCACNHLVNSFHKLQMHTTSLRHQCFARAYRRVHAADEWRNGESPPRGKYFYCQLCDYGARTKSGILSHLHSNFHVENVNRVGEALMDTCEGGATLQQHHNNADDTDVPEWIVVKDGDEMDGVQMAEQQADNQAGAIYNATSRAANEERERSALDDEWVNERCDDEAAEYDSDDEAVEGNDICLRGDDMADDGTRCCSRCSYTCDTGMELYNHYAALHGEILKRTYATENADAVDETTETSFNNNQRGAASYSTVTCSLCQQDCKGGLNGLEAHLTQAHKVSAEVISRLIALLPPSTPPGGSSSESSRQQHHRTDTHDRDQPSSSTEKAVTAHQQQQQQLFPCPSCSVPFSNVDDLCSHQMESGHFEMKQTPNGAGYLCWWKGCNQYFKTAQSVQMHFREIHAKRQQQQQKQLPGGGVTSDRHSYRFRCNQCSQAFLTEEKLKHHQVYHQMRAATQCAICGRSCRSINALKTHVERAHKTLNASELLQFKNRQFAALTSGKIEGETNTDYENGFELNEDDEMNDGDEEDDEEDLTSKLVIEEKPTTDEDDSPALSARRTSEEKFEDVEDYLNTPEMAGSAYLDPSRKFKCHRCKVAFTRQSYLSVHNRTVSHRRGEKLSVNMEKYLDPNRPYKCEICMDSFTQKNILLVHQNSVMHLHKLKKLFTEGQANGNMKAELLSALSKNQTANVGGAQANMNAKSASSSPSFSVTTSASKSDPKTVLKRVKCDACDTYVTDSTWETHVRSVKHRSRMAKTSQSKMDPVDLAGSREPNAKQLLNEAISKKHFQHQSPIAASSPLNNDSASSTAAAAAAAASFQSAAALLSMAGFAAPFLAAQAAAYQDQLMDSSGTRTDCPSCGDSFASPFALENHLESGCNGRHDEDNNKHIPSAENGCAPTSAIAQALYNSNRVAARGGRGNVYKRLLEDYGFEVVMQFNEAQPQKRPKLIVSNAAENNNENDENEAPKREKLMEIVRAAQSTVAPEVTKCVCPHCNSTFSSVWVLKAHAEQVHGSLVPFDCVEETSEEFKSAYEKKYSSSGAAASSGASADAQAHARNFGQSSTSSSHRNTDMSSQQAMRKSQSTASLSSANQTTEMLDEQQQQQMLALNALMQQFAAAQFPQFGTPGHGTSNAMALNMNMAAQFPFMGMPFSTFGSPFLPFVMPPGLDQLSGYGSTTPTSSTTLHSSAPSVTSSTSTNQKPMFVAPPPPTQSVVSCVSSPATSLISQQQQQQQQNLLNQNQKRARTRITDDQIKILREYFNINNSPTEEQIEEMSRKSGLPQKVIKHWFRNTLFKERQRCKDSPYNFSIPPSLGIDLEAYEKTGEAKIISLCMEGAIAAPSIAVEINQEKLVEKPGSSVTVKVERTVTPSNILDGKSLISSIDKIKQEIIAKKEDEKPARERDTHCGKLVSAVATKLLEASLHQQAKINGGEPRIDMEQLQRLSQAEEAFRQFALGSLGVNFPAASSAFLSPTAAVQTVLPNVSNVSSCSSSSTASSTDAIANLIANAMSPGGHMSNANASNANNGGGRRANRTRFTEAQIKVLQEFFENNAYPKDDDLEYLSQKLSLSPRVIVVWFQNARQKARKTYENQPTSSSAEVLDERFHRTPGCNYQCKKCNLVFQRYYELIKHQKRDCYKDEGGYEHSASPTPNSSTSTTPRTSLIGGHNRTGSPSFSGVMDFRFGSHEQKIGQSHKRKRSFGDAFDQISEGSGDDQDVRIPHNAPASQISPEQQEMLLRKFAKEPNPSSRHMEKISVEVGLNKRFVQTWFQNARAGERRGGQVAAATSSERQFFNKRCPFCGILFHNKQIMEGHMTSRHAAQFAKMCVDIDNLPDAEEVPTITTVPMPESLMSAARSGSTELAQSMLSFGMVPGTTTVPGSGQKNMSATKNGTEDIASSSSIPLDLSRTVKVHDANFENSDNGNGADIENYRYAIRTPSVGNSNGDDMSMDEFEDSRSAYDDQDSPSQNQVLAALARPQKRFRTHLTSQQVKVMKNLFRDYRTPTMAECETLGQEIGLHKRVVQVWFQNARAKERKAKATIAEQALLGGTPSSSNAEIVTKPAPTRCDLCSTVYSSRTTLQDHLFSKGHLEKIRAMADGGDDERYHSSPKAGPAGDSSGDGFEKVHFHKGASSKASSIASVTPVQPRQQQSATPNNQQQKSQHDSLVNAMTQNFLPYMSMYASGGLPSAYYAGLASSMMYPGGFSGMSGVYDPNVHGTPVNMLQIPPAVMKNITASLAKGKESSYRFTQDGLTVGELSKSLDARDRRCLADKDLEVGWACRRCTTVFQSEAFFASHQRMVCQSKEPAFRLIQTHYECRLCNIRFGTQVEFHMHCQTPEHTMKAEK